MKDQFEATEIEFVPPRQDCGCHAVFIASAARGKPLSQVPGLKVIARTSSFAFKGKNQDVRKIAEALGVTNLLEGSVRRTGDRLRVTAQLIHATDGTHRWSHKYDRDVVDVFAVQDEIATSIAAALKTKMTAQSADGRAHEPKLHAYEAFLKARHYWGRHFLKTAEEQGARASKSTLRRRSSWIPTGPTLILDWANYISIGPGAGA